MQSTAATVEEYLASLPEDRRLAISAVREVILQNLDADYAEGMQYGMIGYFVPHSVFPAGYHCDPKEPLCFAGLASQKNYMSLYLMGIYGSDAQTQAFVKAWKKTGKKLDMGKSCIRFKKLDDLPLELIGATIARVPAKKHVANYLAMLKKREKSKPVNGTTTTSKAAKPAKPAKAVKKAKRPVKKKSSGRT